MIELVNPVPEELCKMGSVSTTGEIVAAPIAEDSLDTFEPEHSAVQGETRLLAPYPVFPQVISSAPKEPPLGLSPHYVSDEILINVIEGVKVLFNGLKGQLK